MITAIKPLGLKIPLPFKNPESFIKRLTQEIPQELPTFREKVREAVKPEHLGSVLSFNA